MNAQNGGNRIQQIRFDGAEFGIGQMIEPRQPTEKVCTLGHGDDEHLPHRWKRPIFLARYRPVYYYWAVIIFDVQIFYQCRELFIISRDNRRG